MKIKDFTVDYTATLKRLFSGGNFSNIVIPYWLSTMKDVGYGFIKIQLTSGNENSLLIIEELEYKEYNNSENYPAYMSVDILAKNPFKYLKLYNDGYTIMRNIEYSYIGLGEFKEYGRGGLCSFMLESIKSSMNKVGVYNYCPYHISVSGENKKIHAVVDCISDFLKNNIYEPGKISCVAIIF